MASNRTDDQEISMLSLHLVQLSLVYINTLMIQQVLAEPAWQNRLNAHNLRESRRWCTATSILTAASVSTLTLGCPSTHHDSARNQSVRSSCSARINKPDDRLPPVTAMMLGLPGV